MCLLHTCDAEGENRPNNKASHPGGHALSPAPTAQSSVPLELQRRANLPPSSEISLGPEPAEDGKWEGRSPACAGRRGIHQSPRRKSESLLKTQVAKRAGKSRIKIHAVLHPKGTKNRMY